MRFTGKTIVVTGSGREQGLGQAILQRFASEGANCVVSDLAISAEAQGVVADLKKRGGKVEAFACDVGDVGQCRALADAAVGAFGGIDIWVNNAGISFMMQPLLDADPGDWDRVL